MATFTTTKSGLASDSTVWGGSPADGDTINVNHALTWDLNQTALTLGWVININSGGTITPSTTPGSYLMKVNGTGRSLSGGALAYGNSGSRYPANCTFTVQLVGTASQWYIDDVGGVNLWGQVPTRKYVKLTAQAASGQPTMQVDADLTADIWVGALVMVCNTNKARNAVEYTVASVTATSITLTGNLSNTILSGSYVYLTKSNIRFIGAGTDVNTKYIFRAGTNATLESCHFDGVEVRGGYYGFGNFAKFPTDYSAFNNTTIVGNSNGIYNIVASVGRPPVSVENALIINNTSGIVTVDNSMIVRNTHIAGNLAGLNTIYDGGVIDTSCFVGNTSDISTAANLVILSSTFVGSTNVSPVGSAKLMHSRFIGCTFDTLTRVLYEPVEILMMNCAAVGVITPISFGRGSNAELYDCTGFTLTNDTDVGGGELHHIAYYTAGVLQSYYTQHASMVSQSSVVPSGYASAYQCAVIAATTPATSRPFVHDIPLSSSGLKILREVWLRRTFTPATMPSVQIFRQGDDPLWGGTIIQQWNMTAALNTWQKVSVNWTPPSAGDYVMRLHFADTAANAGSVYAAWREVAIEYYLATDVMPTDVSSSVIVSEEVPVKVDRTITASVNVYQP